MLKVTNPLKLIFKSETALKPAVPMPDIMEVSFADVYDLFMNSPRKNSKYYSKEKLRQKYKDKLSEALKMLELTASIHMAPLPPTKGTLFGYYINHLQGGNLFEDHLNYQKTNGAVKVIKAMLVFASQVARIPLLTQSDINCFLEDTANTLLNILDIESSNSNAENVVNLSTKNHQINQSQYDKYQACIINVFKEFLRSTIKTKLFYTRDMSNILEKLSNELVLSLEMKQPEVIDATEHFIP